ncbi:MAG: molybdenum ABC transporter ATP-binding protein [Deltaproteobacteria bacterium]|jgi:molybdate transport system ATP-binding protein|nr:molybdenum ABC transporter ATP-binding protein [Deltaproteobacteria bacterium]
MRVELRRRQGTCLIDVAFQSAEDGISALFGPSGAGKSSIINMVAGLQQPDSGTVSIRGRCLFDSARGINLPPERRNIGYVFQEALLFPHLSVRGNLLYGRRRNQAGGKGIGFDQVVKLLGIEDLLSRKPKTLSGGEKQRVAFGRAVLSNPDILLMDEPLASLDDARKEELLPFIASLSSRFKIPILYVSHSLEEILALTGKIITLANGGIVETAQA